MDFQFLLYCALTVLVLFALVALKLLWDDLTFVRPVRKLTKESSRHMLRHWYLRCIDKNRHDLAALIFGYWDQTDAEFAEAHNKWMSGAQSSAFGGDGWSGLVVDEAKAALRSRLQSK